ADRLEVLQPPYKVVQQQKARSRGKLKIVAARLEKGRTLVLTTDPHPLPVTYALTIPGVKAVDAPGAGMTVDLDYDLSGNLTRSQQALLAHELPHGRELAPALERSYDFPVAARNVYPFIHSPETDIGTNSLILAGGDYERGRSLFFGENLK